MVRANSSTSAAPLGSVLTLALVLLCAGPAAAQNAQRPTGPPAGVGGAQQAEAVNRYLFQPRLVMASANEIGLTEEQRAAIEAAMGESRESYRRARFELSNALTVIAALAVQHPIDEAEILEQLDAILEMERQIKRDQLLMLVRIKNALTPDQHLQLQELKTRQMQRQQQQRQQQQRQPPPQK